MIAIIVDNPKRDLPVLCRISENLIKYGVINKILLVPFYNLKNFLISDLFLITNLIIFNYLRKNNTEIIKFCKSKSIKVVIYDQEGAPGPKANEINKTLSYCRDYIKYIDGYFFWGNWQKKLAISKFNFVGNTPVVGFLRHLQKKNKKKKEQYILINSNFGFFPKYSYSKKEFYEGISMGLGSNANITYQNQYDIYFNRRAKFINTIKNIVLNNPKKNFLLRPHPYEEIKIYKDLIINCPNLKLDTSSNSIESINNCKLLIHLDCTTAVEAFFLKKPVISLKYILDKNDQNMYFKISHHIGLLAKNENEVIELIKKNNFRNKNLFRCNKKIISEIFGNQSSISNFVSEIKKIYVKKDKIKSFNTSLDFRTRLILFLQKFLSKKIYDFFLTLYRGKKVVIARKDKKFSKKDIFKFLSSSSLKIKKIEQFYLIQK